MEHITTFRGLNAEAKSQIAGYIHDPAMRNRLIAQTIREQFPEFIFTSSDVKNSRDSAKQTALGGYTPTQAMCRDIDQREGVEYTVKWLGGNPNIHKMEDLYVTHKFGIRMLKITLGTVIVMTPFDNSAPIACGLINTELEAGFDCLMEQYREHRARVTDDNLFTATTDTDTAMRNALRKLLPDTQLQLCNFSLEQESGLEHLPEVGREEGVAPSSIARIGPGRTFQRRQEQRVDQSPPRFLGVDQVEFSKAGIWAQWEIVSTRETASEFQAEWDKMLVLFAAQTEIVKYFNRQIKPTIREWSHCFTRFNLNFGHRTTSPVESANRMLKSYGLSENSTLDETMKLYFDMVKPMKRGYEEAIFKRG
ncbi:hypothetical protein PsorP6_017768 [Peronosclerospora sorghi]|uniref:Uncharacterized protein n=1 Tax=Peronosclerospora sorghi TaxID=230839 RepID=A0ACC0WMS4_9STRA|nr:hypothetical protein PsorP6_017768 [Peronosclerospora sorghi]